MSHDTHNAEAHAAHGHSYKPFIATLGALLVLTIITVVAAGFDFGAGNVVIALGIATIKASLVALIFMHLAHDKAVNAVIAVSGFLFLSLMLLFCLLDINFRDPLAPGTLKEPPKVAAPAAPAAAAPEHK